MNISRLLAALLLGVSALVIAGPAAAEAPTKGEVLEVRDVDMYTYLRLKTAQGETWAAVEKAPVKVGAQVSINNPMVMRNFESKSLKKTFDKIVFGSLVDPSQTAAAKGASPHAGMGAVATVTPAVAKLSKAAGADARTVAEVLDGAAKLKDKGVTLHAQVVKASLGIMGKNWFHVQDGSGMAGANDILVTSQDKAAVGDVLTIKGTVRTGVSLGSGYDYAVMVENASLRK
ncbi:MAG: nucleotide-binding protein [Burkholderiales bacterium]|nr:nucleotide-binding protein [Burkholderiales bacterium]